MEKSYLLAATEKGDGNAFLIFVNVIEWARGPFRIRFTLREP
jgi:hypothetical protein